MKLLKKSLAMLLAVTMVLGLVTVGVMGAPADESVTIDVEVSKTTVGQGSSFDVTVYYTFAGYATETVTPMISGATLLVDKSKFDFVDKSSELTGTKADVNLTTNPTGIVLGGMSKTFKTAKTAVAKIGFTAKGDAAIGDVTFDLGSFGFTDSANGTLTVNKGTLPTVTIARAFTVDTVTPMGAQNVEFNAKSEAEVKAALAAIPVAVANGGDNGTLNIAAEDWTTADYDQDKVGTYTFTGTLKSTELITVPDAKKTVNVSVTVNPIAADASMVELPEFFPVFENAEEPDALTAVEVAALINADEEFTSATISNGTEAYDETVTITWTATGTLDITTVGNTVALTGTVAFGTGTNYSGTVEVNLNAKVVLAQIDGSAVELTTAPSLYVNPVVKITLAEVPAENDEIAVTFTEKVVEGEAATYTYSYTVTAADVAAGKTEFEITFDKTLADMGFEDGDTVIMTATKNDADLAFDGTALAPEFEAKRPVSTGGVSGSLNNNAGNKPSTDEPGTDEPGTDESGTDEPGTDEPGTDEPGTDEPGTDAPEVDGIFEDVAADHWAAAPIAKLKEAGIINGKSETTFAPDDNVTRAEVAKMIAIIKGLEATEAATFEDCDADAWYASYVAAVAEAGIVTGISETEFAPEATITRQDLFTLVGRALGVTAGEVALDFVDADEIADYAVEYVKVLVELGIVEGDDDGELRPTDSITRAEAAKVIAALYDIVNAPADAE